MSYTQDLKKRTVIPASCTCILPYRADTRQVLRGMSYPGLHTIVSKQKTWSMQNLYLVSALRFSFVGKNKIMILVYRMFWSRCTARFARTSRPWLLRTFPQPVRNCTVKMVETSCKHPFRAILVSSNAHSFSLPNLQSQSEVKFFLHNHLRFTILYHKDATTDLARIVGFEVEPFSVKHDYEPPWDKATPTLNTCNPGRMTYVTHNLPPQPVVEGVEAIFSYDVKFVVRSCSLSGD